MSWMSSCEEMAGVEEIMNEEQWVEAKQRGAGQAKKLCRL